MEHCGSWGSLREKMGGWEWLTSIQAWGWFEVVYEVCRHVLVLRLSLVYLALSARRPKADSHS